MDSLIRRPVSAGRHLAVWLVWQATGTSLVRDSSSRARTPGGALGARCPITGLGVPECSCPRCIEEQVRDHRPDLFGAHDAV
jgi:hypothetical protein